jgi:hypothetical protein
MLATIPTKRAGRLIDGYNFRGMACTGNIKNHLVSIAHTTRPAAFQEPLLRRFDAVRRVERGLLVLRCRRHRQTSLIAVLCNLPAACSYQEI